VLQKAVTPQVSAAYLRGYDRVAGFFVPVDAADWARTPADLFIVHALGFPGSPIGPDADHVDVLRMPVTAQLQVEDAIGGTDATTRAITGGPFIDRPPFTGNGFAPVPGHVVPVYWMRHSRVPAGTELIRFDRTGTATLLARYVDIAHTWVGPSVVAGGGTPRLTTLVGPQATWLGATFSADVLDDSVVLATEGPQPPQYRFEQTAAGRWRREIARSEAESLYELQVTGRLMGLAVRVVDSFRDGQGTPVSRVSSIERNADVAEGLGLEKLDAGVYEATVPTSVLTDVEGGQLIPRSWTT
jgi:hypothetical protein